MGKVLGDMFLGFGLDILQPQLVQQQAPVGFAVGQVEKNIDGKLR